MNQVEVKVARCFINLNATASYSVCLRIGKHVSDMSPEKQPDKGVILFNQNLRLTVTQSTLQVNPKCSIAIYMRRENQERKIVGMVTIKVDQAKQPNAEIDTFKIEQSPDRNARLQAVMHIYRESPENPGNTTAISSLSQIRDFHQFLTSGTTPKNNQQSRFKFSAGSGFGNGFNNDRRISEISIPSKVDSPPKHCRCQQYQATIQKLTLQVSDFKSKAAHFQGLAEASNMQQKKGASANLISNIQQNNNFLKEIVSIQQKKNLLSNKFINQILRVLDIPSEQIKIIKGGLQLQQTNPFRSLQFSTMSPVSAKMSNSPNQEGAFQFGKDSRQSMMSPIGKQDDKRKEQQKIRNYYEDQIKKISKERDEFFQLSQDLYRQINAQKEFKMELNSQLRQKQISQMAYQEAVEKLKYELEQAKKKSSSPVYIQNSHSQELSLQRAKSEELGQRVKQLEASNKQLERKFLETFEGLKQFKNDSLSAKQEIINKDQEIERLIHQHLELQAKYDNLKSIYEKTKSTQKGAQNHQKAHVQKVQRVSAQVINPNLVKLLTKSIEQRRTQKQNERNAIGFRINEEFIRKAKLEIENSYSKLLKSNRSKEDILNQKRIVSQTIDTYLFKYEE